jgi:hypothetical protein
LNPGAHDRIRTGDLVLTKDTLCRLSYVGPVRRLIITRWGGRRWCVEGVVELRITARRAGWWVG